MRRTKGEGTYETSKTTGKVRLKKRVNGRVILGPWETTKERALSAWVAKSHAPIAQAARDAQGPIRSLILELFPEGEYASERFLEFAARWSPSTIDPFRLHCLAVAADPVSAYRFSDLTPRILLNWLSKGTTKPRTRKNRLHALRTVASIFGFTIPSVEVPALIQTEAQIVSVDQWEQYLSLARKPWHRIAMLLMFQCGLRRSEALAVRKEDIEGGVILIRGRVIQQRVEGTKRSSVIYQPMTKTKRPRQVPIIDPWLLEVAANSPPGFLVHERDPSLPLTPNKVTNALTDLAHGTPFEGVSPQDLRRSAATAFAVSNVPLAIAETIMGHQSKILKEVYARVNSEHQANAMRTAFRTGDLSVTYPKCQTMPERSDSGLDEPEISVKPG